MIQLVRQKHDCGCFVASLAMLLGCSYEDAFKKVFPRIKNIPISCHEWPKSGYELTPEKALRVLDRNGIKVKKAKIKRTSSLRKRTALIMLRWKFAPQMMHSLIFDGETGKLLDPFSHTSYKRCNKNMEAIYYVKLPKKTSN